MTLSLPLCRSTPDQCVPPGVYRDMPAYEYHRMNAVSSGLLKLMDSEGPSHCYEWLDRESQLPTAAMRFGTAVHAALLEPDVYAAGVEIEGLSANAVAKTFARHEKEHGPIILASGWKQAIARIVSKVRACDDAPDFSRGDRELTVVWDQPTPSGFVVRCKARIDHLDSCLTDIKTTRKIRTFSRDAHNLGYPIQIAHYSAGASTLESQKVTSALILAVENEPPFDVAVMHPSKEWIEYGNRKWIEALDRLAFCIAMDDWSSVEVMDLELPRYA